MREQPQPHEVERAFADAMQQAGFLPGNLQTDTREFVRFDAPGDKPGKRNGFYKLLNGKFPVGWFGDWKTGEQHQWNFWGEQHELTDAEKRQIKAEQRRLKIEADEARETKQAEVTQEASRLWGKATASVEGHPYLERKGITVPRSLKQYQATDGAQLIAVPMYAFDLNGTAQLTSLQMIDGAGSKRFLKGGRVDGCFFSLKGDSAIIVICEGVATAFSIWATTGLSTVAAFNSGNLLAVAIEFHRWRPQATILIAADNDEVAPPDWNERGQGRPWKNAGILAAKKTSERIECRYVYPVFERGPGRERTDFNDLHLLEGDDALKRQIGGAFRAIEADHEQATAPAPERARFEEIQDETWRGAIPRTSQGSLDGGNVRGVQVYLQNHRLLKARLRFNQLTKAIEVDANEYQDLHATEFRRIMHADNFKCRKTDVEDEMAAEAQRDQYDPLRDFLAGCKWDGTQRIDGWLTSYLGVAPGVYTSAVARKFLISAVARALAPGCKVDTMLVLEGPQGLGKSTALRYLFGDQFFVDHLPDFHSKDSFQQLQGAWCVEVGELAAMSKAEVSDVKLFLARLVDKFRPPYAKAPLSIPRRTVFAGSVNPEDNGYLRDPTGARRFWPVACCDIDLAGILRDREQLWAEAVEAFGAKEPWYLTQNDEIDAACDEQAARRERDAWEPVIASWVRSDALLDTSISEVLHNAVKMPPERWTTQHTRRVASALRAIGWQADNGEGPAQRFHAPGSLALAH